MASEQYKNIYYHVTSQITNQKYKLKVSNKDKDIDTNNCRYYFFNDIINLKKFDPNNIKIDEKSDKNIFIYYIVYVTIKDLKYVKINSVNPLYLTFSKVNGNLKENNGNNHLTLLMKGKKKLKHEEQWTKMRYLISSITKSSDDYDEKYMKIKFNSDNELSLKKTMEILTITIVVRAIFHENNKHYPQAFLDECLYKI